MRSNNLYVNLTILAFFSNNSAENCRSENQKKNGKAASKWDLNFSKQKFSSKMNSLAVIFEKHWKMPKVADFANFEPPWSLNENFARYPVCGKMLGI